MPKEVVVYAHRCEFCGRVKEFLSERGVPFTEKDVVEDADAMEELIGMNFCSIPVTLIDGKAVLGFNRKRLEQLLAG